MNEINRVAQYGFLPILAIFIKYLLVLLFFSYRQAISSSYRWITEIHTNKVDVTKLKNFL